MAIQFKKIKVRSAMSGLPNRRYYLPYKREKDGRWWHGWLTRPAKKLGQYLKSLAFLEHLFLAMIPVAFILMLFCVCMALLATFDPPQHDQILISIGVYWE